MISEHVLRLNTSVQALTKELVWSHQKVCEKCLYVNVTVQSDTNAIDFGK